MYSGLGLNECTKARKANAKCKCKMHQAKNALKKAHANSVGFSAWAVVAAVVSIDYLI